MALVWLNSIAMGLDRIARSVGRLLSSGTEGRELAHCLHELLVVKLHCFMEALDVAVGEIRKQEGGREVLRRLGPVYNQFNRARGPVRTYRHRIVAHANADSDLGPEVARIAGLPDVLAWNHWAFLGFLSFRFAELLREAYADEFLQAVNKHGAQLLDSLSIAKDRLQLDRGRSLREMEDEIDAILTLAKVTD